jgi:hypothetical protein
MRESCFCGWSGELEDQEPVLDAGGRWLLRCPTCGHLDDLERLTEEAGLMLWGEARSLRVFANNLSIRRQRSASLWVRWPAERTLSTAEAGVKA